MKRTGFTMIELIFVIVILGILSAVALPKFLGVSDQARAGKCKAFVGTLNRTVGPTVWSQSIADDNNGSVTTYLNSTANTSKYIDVPAECDNPTTAGNIATDYNVTIGNTSHNVNFTDGNTSNAPTWVWN